MQQHHYAWFGKGFFAINIFAHLILWLCSSNFLISPLLIEIIFINIWNWDDEKEYGFHYMLVYCTWLQHSCNECLLRWLLRMRWPHLRSERQPSMRACTDPSMHTPKRKHANTYDGGCKLKVGKTHGSCFATTCPSPLSPRRGRRAKTCCIIMSSTCGIIALNYLQY